MDLETALVADLHSEFLPGLAQPMLVVARDAQVGQLSEPGTSFLYQAKVLMLHEIGEMVKA